MFIFSSLILFQWISFISLNFCSIMIPLTRHFKGHKKILASMLYKSYYPESHCQCSISNGISLQKFDFSLTKCFWKKQNIYIECTSIFFLLFSYSASISLWYDCSFLYNFLPIHSKVSIGVQDKWMFEFPEAPVQ